MIRLLIILAIALVLGGIIYNITQMDNAYLVMVLNNSTYTISITALIIYGVLAIIALYCLYKLFRSTRKVIHFSQKRAEKKTYQGLIYFIEGNWSQAKRYLSNGADKSSMPIVNYLASAHCSHELGDEQSVMNYLHKAKKDSDQGLLAALLTQAKLQFEQQQYESVLQTLQRAKALAPHHPMVLHLLSKTHLALGDWPALAMIMPELNRYQVGSTKAREELEQTLYRSWFDDTLEQAEGLETEPKLAMINQRWQATPKEYHLDEVLLGRYVSQLMYYGHHSQAEAILTRALKKQWHDSWVNYYGLLVEGNAKKRLSLAESWLKAHGDSETLLLALGRLSLQNHQWQEAVAYFEKSLELKPMAETYAELSRLQAHLGDTDKSRDYAEKGLQFTAHVLPDLPMPQAVETKVAL